MYRPLADASREDECHLVRVHQRRLAKNSTSTVDNELLSSNVAIHAIHTYIQLQSDTKLDFKHCSGIHTTK